MTKQPKRTRGDAIRIGLLTTLLVAGMLFCTVRILVPSALEDAPAPLPAWLLGVSIWVASLGVGVIETLVYWPRE